MLVLYVDDEPSLLELVKEFLEQNGEFTIDTATSASEALELLKRKNYDAIISDYQMPEGDGITFLKEIRSAGNRIPFIIFTGRGREEVVIQALNNGADSYLQKGGDPKPLFAELAHVVQRAVLMRRTLMTLAEQEQRYHDIQNATDLIQSVNPEGHFLFVNKKWTDTLGYSEKELENLTIFDIIHEDSRQHCMEIFPRVVHGEDVGIIEAVFRARDGTKVFIEGMATCQISDGKPLYTRGIFKDVTEKKKTESALIESEARYRNVVEDQTELISRCRPDWTHVFVNNAYCRYFSTSREEIIGRRIFPEIPPEDLSKIHEHFASLTRQQPVARISHRIFLPGGEVRWQEWTNRAIFDDSGTLIEYQSVGRDITDLKMAEQELLRKNEEIHAAYEQISAAEEELRGQYMELVSSEKRIRDSEEKYRTLFNNTSDEVYTHELQSDGMPGNFLEVNDIMCSKLGYSREELLGMTVRDIVSDSHKKMMGEIKEHFSETDVSTFYGEHKRKDGSVFPVEITIRRIRLSGKKIVLAAARDITDRRAAEEALREQEVMFRVIFDNSPYPISINNIPDGKFLAVNAAFLRSSGFSTAEILGKNPYELGLLSLIDYGRLGSHLVVKGKIENMPMVLTGKGGKRVHVLFSTLPVTINDHAAILTVTAEITKLKRVEEELLRKNEEINTAYQELKTTEDELRQNYDELSKKEQALKAGREEYRAMYNDNPIMLFTMNTDGIIISVNQFGAASLGYTIEELKGRPVLDVFYPDDRPAVTNQFRICLQSPGEIFSWQFRKIRKDNSLLWVDERARAVPGPDGTLTVLVVCQDITDQKRVQDELVLLKISVDAAYDEVFWLDFAGNILYANDAACRNTGYSWEEFRHMKIFALDPDYNPEIYEKAVSDLRANKSRFFTTRHRCKNGSLLDVEIMSVYVNKDNREYSFSFVRDITERKRTEQTLEVTNRKLSLLNSITRHDILNNITVLAGYLSLARESAVDPKMAKYLEKLETAKDNVVSQIEFTRIYQDLGTMAPIWQDLGRLMEKLPASPGLTLQAECKDVIVYADPILEKVFFNLLDNSVRHGKHVTLVRVSAHESPDGLIIAWEDDGTGIPENEKERIFIKGYGKNTGLGLFLSREILSITGMTIKESGTPGKGASFEITVPGNAYRIDHNRP
ncbi:PAS domain S-box protein [uncultured Methanoregula sp.]|uniref:PAS domain S-box protein n=1 Tax=uncultured Methanoregula sp. TaxID=1005933 RepID=UPI002AABB96A|nr:PAS domain S-box protein [uncultured Methanoregula sp.]